MESSKIKRFIDANSTTKQCVETGIVVSIVFVFAGIYLHRTEYMYLAIGAQFINLLVPRFYHPIAIIWFGFSKLIGAVTSKVILAAVFFLIVTPVGLIRRMQKKDRLHIRKFKKGKQSVFLARNHVYDASDLKNTF